VLVSQECWRARPLNRPALVGAINGHNNRRMFAFEAKRTSGKRWQSCYVCDPWPWDRPTAQGLLMPLSLRERLTMLMPPSVFYRQRIAQEARTGEPELAVLAKLVPRGGIAVDVGANVGFFAYALADIADRVVAFEPNPDYAFFARWMLRGRAEVRE